MGQCLLILLGKEQNKGGFLLPESYLRRCEMNFMGNVIYLKPIIINHFLDAIFGVNFVGRDLKHLGKTYPLIP